MTALSTPVTLPNDVLSHFEGERHRPFPFLLDSALSSSQYGRQTLLGSDPFTVLVAKGRSLDLYREGRHRRFEGDPFETLRSLLLEFRTDDDPDHAFPGGAVGWFGYDLGAHIERLPRRAAEDQNFPDLVLAFHDRAIRIDHETGRAEILDAPGRRRRRAMTTDAYREIFADPAPVLRPGFTQETYLPAIARAKEYIAAGDIYQVNLSRRLVAPFDGDPFALYRRLRTASPAPYAAFLECGNLAVLSSSPEQFVRVDGRTVSTRPIKGTRRRGNSSEEDERLRSELHASPKDDAELAMIVDLERNDLGRVCVPGSVRVVHPKVLETHPTVFHLSATIEGTLRRDADLVDVLKATFPGGSVTGAPKIRAMQILDELEPTRRAVYTGAIGYLTFDGRMETSIAIRTMLVHDRLVTFQTGGAIVWDSDPEAEFEETRVKARAMAQALNLRLE